MDLRSFSFTLFFLSLDQQRFTFCSLRRRNGICVFGCACTMSHEFSSTKSHRVWMCVCVCVYIKESPWNWLGIARFDDLFIIAFTRKRKTQSTESHIWKTSEFILIYLDFYSILFILFSWRELYLIFVMNFKI